MSEIVDNLNILRNTQMVQRKDLEQLYPYLDFDRVPFSSYGDLFAARQVRGCQVWANAYGRSNDETDEQRKFLKDHSGNGRDIELFNFGYSRESGFNGYVQDFRLSGTVIENANYKVTATENTVIIDNGNSGTWTFTLKKNNYVNESFDIIIESESDGGFRLNFITSDYQMVHQQTFKKGRNTVEKVSDDILDQISQISFEVPHNSHTRISQLPKFPGALLSDGVDDYGQCIKDFSLPEDYTVVAMRKHIGRKNTSMLLSLANGKREAPFRFEYMNGSKESTYSYGYNTPVTFPELFSSQSKQSYNGASIIAGGETGAQNTSFLIFTETTKTTAYCQAALYSFAIFDHTLTEHELRIVKNAMFAEYIAGTGVLDDVEYYDILDARFRSNDENEEQRKKWTGLLGRLHLKLNNYAYRFASGWNALPFGSFTKMTNEDLSNQTESKITITKTSSDGWRLYVGANSFRDNHSFALRVKYNTTNKNATLKLLYSNGNNAIKGIILTGGVNIIPPQTDVIGKYYNTYFDLGSFNQGDSVDIEQIPMFPGALVSDGVDDYAVSDEAIDEPINAVAFHATPLGKGYLYCSGISYNDKGATIAAHVGSAGSDFLVVNGTPKSNFSLNETVLGTNLSQEAVTNEPLIIAATGLNHNDPPVSNGQWALHQLRLIKTVLTDAQIESIKWQMGKEHEDYLIQMGWNVIDEQ